MQFRRAPTLWIQRTFWGIYPVALYYGMVALERSVDLRRYLGPDPLGSKVIKLFIFAGASMLLFGWVGGVLEYLERRSAIHPQLARVLYQPLIYPLEYFWFSFPLLFLSSVDLHPLGRDPWYILFLVVVASFGGSAVAGWTRVEEPSLFKYVFLGAFFRSMLMAVLSLASLVVFVVIR